MGAWDEFAFNIQPRQAKKPSIAKRGDNQEQPGMRDTRHASKTSKTGQQASLMTEPREPTGSPPVLEGSRVLAELAHQAILRIATLDGYVPWIPV